METLEQYMNSFQSFEVNSGDTRMMHNCTTGFSANCSGFSIVDFEQVTPGLDNVFTHSVKSGKWLCKGGHW